VRTGQEEKVSGVVRQEEKSVRGEKEVKVVIL